MAKKITKNINAKFNPTLLDGYNTYGYGGKKYFWSGGSMQPMQSIQPNVVGPETLQAMNTSQLDPMTMKSVGNSGGMNINADTGQGIADGANLIGNTMDAFTMSNNNKPYEKHSVAGGAVKGAAAGAGAGMVLGPWGAAIGGVVGGAAGAIGAGLGNKSAKQGYLNDIVSDQKQNLISNLPGQSSYVPTFEMGGDMNMMGGNKEILDRVSSVESNTTHEQSPYGGVPISNNALVEKDEFLYTNKAGKKYVFSNKLFR